MNQNERIAAERSRFLSALTETGGRKRDVPAVGGERREVVEEEVVEVVGRENDQRLGRSPPIRLVGVLRVRAPLSKGEWLHDHETF